MLSAVTTVCQRGIMAAGFFQSVSQDRQKIEGAVGVDGLSKVDSRAVAPKDISCRWTKRIAEDATESLSYLVHAFGIDKVLRSVRFIRIRYSGVSPIACFQQQDEG